MHRNSLGSRHVISRLVLLVLAAASICGQVRGESDISKKVPVPAAEKLKEAEALIRDLFNEEFRKTNLADQQAFAAKLLQQGLATKDDLAARYQLFEMARELASKVGDVGCGLGAVDALDANFVVEATALKVKVLADAERFARTKDQILGLAQYYMVLGEQAAGKEDFLTAVTCATKSQQFSRASKEVALYTKATKRLQDYQARRTAFEGVKAARQKLFEMPDDPQANLSVGKYYVMIQNDWERGLPCLVKGSDAAWKAAATTDLAKPTEGAQQVQLGDLWFDLSTKGLNSEEEPLKLRAAYWYGQALSSISGLTRTKVERRLAELQPLITAASVRKGDEAVLVGISEATRKALPTEEEVKKLKELWEAKVKGDEKAEQRFYSERYQLARRLGEDPKEWSDEDFKIRREAELKLNLVGDDSRGTTNMAHVVYQNWQDYAGASSGDAQFLSRMKDGEGDYGKYYSRFSYRGGESPWDSKVRIALQIYLAKNSARFSSTVAKAGFCDWLKSNGIASAAVGRFKDGLLGTSSSSNSDGAAKTGE